MPLPAHLRSHKNHTYLLFLLIQKPSFLTPLLCCFYWLAGRLLSESRVRFEVPTAHQLMHNFLNARRQCAFLHVLPSVAHTLFSIIDRANISAALLISLIRRSRSSGVSSGRWIRTMNSGAVVFIHSTSFLSVFMRSALDLVELFLTHLVQHFAGDTGIL